MKHSFYLYLLVMAGVTYLVRMIPLVLVKKKITNKYIVSFLHYIPCAVLTVMTVPAVFYATTPISAVVGFLVAVIIALYEKSLVLVAAVSCFGVFLTNYIINII